eukprot:scaffold12691_cov108-Isochrysis_galbana.AAC.8
MGSTYPYSSRGASAFGSMSRKVVGVPASVHVAASVRHAADLELPGGPTRKTQCRAASRSRRSSTFCKKYSCGCSPASRKTRPTLASNFVLLRRGIEWKVSGKRSASSPMKMLWSALTILGRPKSRSTRITRPVSDCIGSARRARPACSSADRTDRRPHSYCGCCESRVPISS